MIAPVVDIYATTKSVFSRIIKKGEKENGLLKGFRF